MSGEGTFYLCTNFEHYFGMQAIVRARTASAAGRAASDPYYGRPATVRRATADEIRWQFESGGDVIEAAA